MQPTLVILSDEPGIIYVNGRFEGETGGERTVARPIAPTGALYIEYRPLCEGVQAAACALALAKGAPVAGSLRPSSSWALAHWPGNVIEVEPLTERREAESCDIAVGGVNMSIRGRLLTADTGRGVRQCQLPRGALAPTVEETAGELILTGRLADGGKYAAALSRETGETLLCLTGADISVGEGVVRVLTSEGDLVGHAELETWASGERGYALADREPMWEAGAPRWPRTPEETALALLDAARLGLADEAAGYIAHGCDLTEALTAASALGGAARLKYAPPGGVPAVGVSESLGDNCVRVRPVYYDAAPSGGPQGGWRVSRLAVG